MIGALIHRLRTGAAFLTYLAEHTDVIMHESNTSVTRPLPLWPYSASDNVNRSRNSEPDKMAINLCMSFVDYPWRFVAVPRPEVQLRLHQSLAHGGPPALAMLGTMDQEDRSALLAARPVFQWHARHEDLYVGQRSAARVLLLRGEQDAYRGFFRLLTEEHIPFAVSETIAGSAYDLVIAPSGAPAELEPFVRGGGRLLVAGAVEPAFPVRPVIARRPHTQGSWRIHGHDSFPSLEDTNLLFLDGEYLELLPLERPLLTLVPPAMFGPPEKVWVDKVETEIPGLAISDLGEGRVAWIPWNVGGLYYRHKLAGTRGSGRGRDRPPPSRRPAVEDERASPGRDHGDEAAPAGPDPRPPRERERARRHRLLRADRDARHRRRPGRGLHPGPSHGARRGARGHALGRAGPLHPAEAGSVRSRGAGGALKPVG